MWGPSGLSSCSPGFGHPEDKCGNKKQAVNTVVQSQGERDKASKIISALQAEKESQQAAQEQAISAAQAELDQRRQEVQQHEAERRQAEVRSLSGTAVCLEGHSAHFDAVLVQAVVSVTSHCWWEAKDIECSAIGPVVV